jgi:hypothetical protein
MNVRIRNQSAQGKCLPQQADSETNKGQGNPTHNSPRIDEFKERNT